MSVQRKPRCARCGGTEFTEPAPVRTTAHPNSSFLVLETPGAHYHNHTLQGVVCLSCGAVELGLSGPTLAALRGEWGRGARKRRG